MIESGKTEKQRERKGKTAKHRHLTLQTHNPKLTDFISCDRFVTGPLRVAPPLGDASAVKMLLDRGAEAKATDAKGNTLAMLAASSDKIAVETITALIDRGADLNATKPKGKLLSTLPGSEARHLWLTCWSRPARKKARYR